MAKFKLELQLENKSWMTLTDYETGTPSRNISFDETLEENENDAYTLTFSVPEYLESGIRTGSLISIGRVLRLTFSRPERVVWFVVNSFQVGEGTENFIYSVSAQDYVSYVFSRNNAGLNLDTIEDQDFWEWMEEKYPAPNLIVPNLNEAKLGQDGIYTFRETSDGGYLKYDSKTGQYTVKYSGSESFEVLLMPNSFFDKGLYTFSVKYISGTGAGSSSPILFTWGTASSLFKPATKTQIVNLTQSELRAIKITVGEGTFEVNFTLQLEKGEVTNPVHTFAGADNFSPTTVTNIGNYILERGWLKRKNSEETTDWEVKCTDKTFGDDKFYQYNISVSDSNSYNALVELANISDTFMRIDYENRIINFIHRDNYDNILDQNYTLKEGFNLLQSDVAYDGGSLYGMFYINGGTDENDEFVTLSEEVRQKDNFLFDFSYFQEKGIISEQDLIDINKLIYGGTFNGTGWDEILDEDIALIEKDGVQISTRSLYSINSQLQPTITRKYELEGIINSFYTQIIIAAEALMPEGNLASDFPEKYKLLEDKFTSPSQYAQPENVQVSEKINFVPRADISATIADYDEVKLTYPFRYTNTLAPTSLTSTFGPFFITLLTDDPWERYEFSFDLTDPNLSPTMVKRGYKQIKRTIEGFEFWFVWREYEGEPGISYTYLPIDFDHEIYLTEVSFRVEKTTTFDFLIKTYAYFESLFLYDGSRRIQEEKQKFIDRINYFKSEWLKDEISLNNLDSETEDATILAEIEGLRDNIDNYRIAIGDYIFDPTKNTLTPNFVDSGQKGFYQIILDMFNKYEIEFYESLTWEEDGETKTNKILETRPIMDIYRELIELKKTFWFNMKENYGRNIFSEGYYDNEIEVSSFDLRAQAELIYKQHKKPNEDFSITYVNVSDVLGVDLQEIKVGDYIKINKTNIKLQTLENTFLQVSAISRTLRSDADISLTITKYNMINSVIEKIVARSQ